ncbi:hypothetical protein [Microvirga soli]|uniref:hypothetical protein n=1 Tax=Microvirga soli TaxID=1854496 RepID=UPI00191FBE86|nr:hypothetical protein [Microvirga soli]
MSLKPLPPVNHDRVYTEIDCEIVNAPSNYHGSDGYYRVSACIVNPGRDGKKTPVAMITFAQYAKPGQPPERNFSRAIASQEINVRAPVHVVIGPDFDLEQAARGRLRTRLLVEYGI